MTDYTHILFFSYYSYIRYGLFGGDEGNFDDIKRGGRYRSSHSKYHEAKRRKPIGTKAKMARHSTLS